MTTFLFIIIVFIISPIIAKRYVKGDEEKGKTHLYYTFLILAMGIIFINLSGFFPTDEEIKHKKELEEQLEYNRKYDSINKAQEDSINKMPKSEFVKKTYNKINSKKEFDFISSNIDELESAIDKVRGTNYEKKIKKSIDSLINVRNIKREKDELIERQNYQFTLRNSFLDNNLNIKVRVLGKDSRTIKMTYSLFNEVWFRKFEKEGYFLKLHTKGYNKIILTDDYDYTQIYSFKE